MTTDQLEFARKHGITRLPPGPPFRAIWKHWADDRLTEAERIASFCAIYISPDWADLAKHYFNRKGEQITKPRRSNGHRIKRLKG